MTATLEAVEAFPMTADEVHAYRQRHDFVTPLNPVNQGELYCCFSSRGTHEFFAHPVDAAYYLEHGITINGQHHTTTFIDPYPHLGAWQLRANNPDVSCQFVDASQAR